MNGIIKILLSTLLFSQSSFARSVDKKLTIHGWQPASPVFTEIAHKSRRENVLTINTQDQRIILGFNLGTGAEITLQISGNQYSFDLLRIKRGSTTDIFDITAETKDLKLIAAEYFANKYSQAVLESRLQQAYPNTQEMLLKKISHIDTPSKKAIAAGVILSAMLIAGAFKTYLSFSDAGGGIDLDTFRHFAIGVLSFSIGFILPQTSELMKDFFIGNMNQIRYALHRALLSVAVRRGFEFDNTERKSGQTLHCHKFL